MTPEVHAFAELMERAATARPAWVGAHELIQDIVAANRALVLDLKAHDADDCNETRETVAKGCASVAFLLMELAKETGGVERVARP